MEENEYNELPFLSCVGMMLTYKCSIACPHCIVKAGPHRKEEMKLESTLKWVEDISAYKDGFIKGLSLTGGEPLYNLELLKSVSSHAEKHGLIVSIVTNAFWAFTREEAIRVLSELPGVKMVSVSTDENHLKFIPFENIRNAIWAAKKLGLVYKIAVTTENENDTNYIKIMDDLLELTEKDNIQTAVTIPAGRADRKKKSKNYEYSPEPSPAACSMASFPILFPNGDVIACIGPPITFLKPHPLYLGNLNEESLEDIFDRADQDSLLHAIRTFGPVELVNLLKENGFASVITGEYIKELTCDVCIKLFSNLDIINKLQTLKNDIAFKEKVTYGRLYYLNETNMIKEIQKTG